ncbi:MAG: protein-L-isoaspartate O-methyltransferase [Rhodovarius sp.]|nr:protein-L-isoaspartate O-methyltransferase [Rhodovarius sp.]
MDMAAARAWMVDGQLRPNRVTDAALLAAMGSLPREAFVPAGQRARAYADAPVPLAPGRAMPAPLVQARLIQALELRVGESALVVGAGSGYAAAVLALLGARVIALEEDPALVAMARLALPVAVPGARPVLVEGPLAEGWPQGAPYDAILLDGAVEVPPRRLADQLADGGRLACVVRAPGRAPVAMLLRRVGASVAELPLCDASAPLLPGFAATAGFVF